jgi:hypothetical protein
VLVDHVRTIEAERREPESNPPGPEDADVNLNFNGIVKQVRLGRGDDGRAQAAAAQDAFGQTMLCGPIERTGDSYTIYVSKQTVYPVTFVKGEDRVLTWVDKTRIKVMADYARRLFGDAGQLEQLEERGGLEGAPKVCSGKSKTETSRNGSDARDVRTGNQASCFTVIGTSESTNIHAYGHALAGRSRHGCQGNMQGRERHGMPAPNSRESDPTW